MSGITIIDTIDTYETAWWQLILGLIPMFIGALIYFVVWYNAFKKGTPEEREHGVVSAEHYSLKDFGRSFLALAIGGLISIILCGCFSTIWPAKYVETKYEMSVDETVSFAEFYNNYYIVEETERGTFIVKEK